MPAVNQSLDLERLSNLIPINQLDRERRQELLSKAEVLQINKGQSLGSAVAKHQLAYLLSGTIERAPHSPQAEIIKSKSALALQPLIQPGQRTRVVTKTAVSLLCIDNELLDMLMNWGTGSGVEVDELETNESGDWMSGLLQNPAILCLTPANIQALISAVKPINIDAGELIYKQGDKADSFYFIARGSCSILDQKDITQNTELHTGDSFGEVALIHGAPRNSTVRAAEDSMLLKLGKETFDSILAPLAEGISQTQAETFLQNGAQWLNLDENCVENLNQNRITIPLRALAESMAELDRAPHYIVSANSAEDSIAACFLLGQNRFKANWLKQDEVVNTPAPAPAKPEPALDSASSHRAQIDELKRDLIKASNENARHIRSHDEFAERIRQLETELDDRRAEAVQLKQQVESSGSESALLESQAAAQQANLSVTIEQLNGELVEHQQNIEQQIAENQHLRHHLAAMEEQNKQLNQVADQQQASLEDQTDQQDSLAQQLSSSQAELATESAQRQALESKTADLEQQINEQRLLNDQLQLELTDQQAEKRILQSDLNNTKQALNLSENQVAALRERVENLKKNLAKHIQDSQQQIQNLEQERQNALDSLNQELADTQAELEQARQQGQQLQSSLETLQGQHEALRSEHNDALEKITALNAETANQQQELEQRAKQISGLEDDVSDRNQRIETLETDKSGLEKELKTAINYKEHAESEQRCAEENTDFLSSQIETLKTEAASREQELQQEITEIKDQLQAELDKPVVVDGVLLEELEQKIADEQANSSAAEITNNVLEGRLTKLTADLAEAKHRAETAEAAAEHAEQEMAAALAAQSYKQEVEQATSEPETPNRDTATDAKIQAKDEARKLAKLRKNSRKEERARRREETWGQRSVPRLLILFGLFLGVIYGAASYFGIDLAAKAAYIAGQFQALWTWLAPLIGQG